MYVNIHTNEMVLVEDIEIVGNPPINVYVLSNGTRWAESLFFEHWEIIKIR